MRPLVRNAVLTDYVELVRSLDADPIPLLAAAGLDVSDLAAHNRWLRADAVARLLELSAAATSREDFGLLLAEGRRLSILGPVSLAAREEPDIRSALEMLIRYEHLHNEALRTRLSESFGLATVELSLDTGTTAQTRQAAELGVGAAHRIIRSLMGSEWHPLTVCFTHRPPADLGTHHRVLGPSVRFRQDFTGVVFYARDLDAPNTMSDPQLRPYTREYLKSVARPRHSTDADRVREIVEALIPTGRCSLQQVARTLAVDRKTVHRRLAEAGATFSSVLASTRAELAQQYVGQQERTLTDSAELLGFTSVSTFSRWFRAQFGSSPTAWRAARRGAG
jgi:AraC-like DNA-binding protein